MKNYKQILFILIGIYSFFAFKVTAQSNDNATINLYTQLNQDASLILQNKNITPGVLQLDENANIINVKQEGLNNQIDVRANANNSQNVNQLGNSNEYQFINYYNNSPSNFVIRQEGVGNSLQIYGQNSLSEKLQVIQKSNFKTIIIKNY